MGWGIDVFFCAVVGIICTIIAHYIFEIPANNLKTVFFLGFFCWAILGYLLNKIESGSSIVPMICGFLLVVGIVYFFILPMISGMVGDAKVVPANSVQQVKDNSGSPAQQTTATPVEYYKRSYHWTFDHRSFTYTIEIPKQLFDYYRKQPHDRNYAKYAISERDRKVLDRIITSFKENSDSNTVAAYNIVAFVQSLPYFKDNVSTGYDEYPRYPIETLVDNGGDCEDTAILTAALLKEMNYDVVLLRLPTHMAVGIKCSACTGTYYTHDNKKYFYLETTGSNWKVGQIPPQYKDVKVTVYSI